MVSIQQFAFHTVLIRPKELIPAGITSPKQLPPRNYTTRVIPSHQQPLASNITTRVKDPSHDKLGNLYLPMHTSK